MKVEKIDHLGIMVKNVKEAQKFFADLFGMKFASLGRIEEMDAKSMIEPLGIEIFEPLSPDGASASTLKKRGEGLWLLSLKVTNLDEAMAEMDSKGIRLVRQMKTGRARMAIYHPKDIYGVMIELIEYETEHSLVSSTEK